MAGDRGTPLTLLAPALRAQVIISIREDWSHEVHDVAEITTPEEAAKLAGVIVAAAIEVGRKHGVRLPTLEKAMGYEPK